MFFTGVFKIDGESVLANHKIHDEEQYDDDVVSWFSEADEKEQLMYSDGFVSNKGGQMTIHVRPDYLNEETIERLKEFFFHSGETGMSEIKVAVFRGWDIEFFIAGITKGPFRVLKDADAETADSLYIVEHRRGEDIFQCAVYQAWLDMCRTLREGNQKKWIQSRVTLAERMKSYFDGSREITEDAFDEWYYSVNRDIRTVGGFTIGQAQKLINMAFKYLYCCNDLRNEKTAHFTFCHMPLDSYTLFWYKWQGVSSEYDDEVWSKIDDVNKYSQIIKNIREHLGADSLLKKEFKIWQSEKKRREKEEVISCIETIERSGGCSPELKKLLDEYLDLLTLEIQPKKDDLC